MKLLSKLFYVVSVVFLGLGSYKLLFYKNALEVPHGELISTNAYVLDDGMNYLINSTRATTYFALAILFFLVASFIVLYNRFNDLFYIRDIDKK